MDRPTFLKRVKRILEDGSQMCPCDISPMCWGDYSVCELCHEIANIASGCPCDKLPQDEVVKRVIEATKEV